MSGRKDYRYTDDAGQFWAMNLGKGWGEQSGSGLAAIPAGTAYNRFPRGSKPRRAYASAKDGTTTIRRRFIFGTKTATLFSQGKTFTYDGKNWTVTSVYPEVMSKGTSFDSGS